jgi:flagellar basal-body rod protein FlgB
MDIDRLFSGTTELASKALDVRMQRQGLIQSNIANLETPGYRGQDFPFAKVMESVMTGLGRLDRTHPGHIALEPVEVGKGIAFSDEERPVDLDEEMSKLSENQLMYQVTAKLVAKKFEGIKIAIDEGAK